MQKTYKKYFPVFALPTLIAFAIAFLVPFLMGIYLSFCKFTTVTNAKWVGIANYTRAFSNRDFPNALWFTVKFTVISVILINILAFLLALLLTRKVMLLHHPETYLFLPLLQKRYIR